jgi:hypothetical protein
MEETIPIPVTTTRLMLASFHLAGVTPAPSSLRDQPPLD